MEKKTIEEWEKEKAVMLEGEVDPAQEMTEEEFDQIPHSKKVGIMYDVRTQFLQDNGFEVTRENMLDHRLSAGHKIVVGDEILDYDEYLAKTT